MRFSIEEFRLNIENNLTVHWKKTMQFYEAESAGLWQKTKMKALRTL